LKKKKRAGRVNPAPAAVVKLKGTLKATWRM